MTFNDLEILQNYRTDGNNRWMSMLFKKYQSLLYGVCYKYLQNTEDAKDAVMEIFEKLHLDKEKLEDVQNFKAWLYRVGSNHCLMKLRKAGIQYEYKDILQMDWEGDSYQLEQLEEKQSAEKQVSQLQTCMDKLKPDQKQCVELFYYQEKTYKEIETATGWDFKLVKTLLQNGKLNLKKCMQNG